MPKEPSQGVRVSLLGPEWRAVPLSGSRAPALVALVPLQPVSEATGSTLAASSVHVGLFGRVMLEERKVFRPFLLPWMVAQPVDSGWGRQRLSWMQGAAASSVLCRGKVGEATKQKDC